jgi:hypothetical protein
LVSETFHKFRAETRAAQSRKLDEPINKLWNVVQSRNASSWVPKASAVEIILDKTTAEASFYQTGNSM